VETAVGGRYNGAHMATARGNLLNRLWANFPVRSQQTWLNVLLLAVPAAIILKLTGASDVIVFAASALAIMPLAGVLGDATEAISARSGPTLGGVVNATMGNATELIIAIFLLRSGHTEVVKASLSGSILGNLLLVLGVAIIAGCWGRDQRTFSRAVAGTNSTMLFIAVAALVMPAVFDLGVFGSLKHEGPEVQVLSMWTGGVLIAIYLASFVFMMKTHKHAFRLEDAGDKHEPGITAGAAVLSLVITTTLIAYLSELLVHGIEAVTKTVAMSEFFVGAIVVAIIGNAAEHSTAVVVARRGKMDLALTIAIGSSSQIALFVAPVLVFLSVAMGHPMSLVFNGLEVAAIFLSVIIVEMISSDGETNWFEGAQLIAVYLIVAVSFYFVPNG
jgi:Ca2+:H+ antiporter